MSFNLQSYAHRIGAIFFMLWGLLHIVGAGVLLWSVPNEGASSVLSIIGSALPPQSAPPTPEALVGAILAYYAWNLIWIGGLVLVVGAMYNWRNSRPGYWLNLTVVSAADIGLIYLLLLPGYMAWSDGMMGIALWLPAALFGAWGVFPRGTTRSANTPEMVKG